jgi:cytochrome c biogenesis protein
MSVFPDARNPRLIITAWTGDLGVNDGVPRSVYVLDVSKMKRLTVDGKAFSSILATGQSAQLPDKAGTVTFDGVKRYAALNVRSDPTKIWVLVFAVIALAGLTASLFIHRRRVWVRASTDSEGRTVVEVAGLVRQENLDVSTELEAIMAAVTRSPRTSEGGTDGR